jgi:hypothetical protein
MPGAAMAENDLVSAAKNKEFISAALEHTRE